MSIKGPSLCVQQSPGREHGKRRKRRRRRRKEDRGDVMQAAAVFTLSPGRTTDETCPCSAAARRVGRRIITGHCRLRPRGGQPALVTTCVRSMLSLYLYTNIFKIGNSFPVNDFMVSSLGWLEAIFAVECDMQPPNAAVAVAPGLELAAAYRRTVSPAHRAPTSKRNPLPLRPPMSRFCHHLIWPQFHLQSPYGRTYFL